MLTKYIVQPLDLMSVDLCDGTRVYSFLGAAWALVSDIDIESEKYRALGSVRFMITGISKILSVYYYFYNNVMKTHEDCVIQNI